ncbi:S-adenosyl-L-methionine-dependent methyltransferase [Mycena sp. CBHHK59/15]|nr:S-adenosyl-L-methionine-dependent methyltransferase [Mycena sp. CBHHK59/15]
MSKRPVPYVLVPPSPWTKREAPDTPSPAAGPRPNKRARLEIGRTKSLSPTVTEIVDLTGSSDEDELDSIESAQDQTKLATPADIVFEYQETTEYLEEAELLLEDDDDSQSIPIRRLEDFTIFKCVSLCLVDTLELLGSLYPTGSSQYGASGRVSAIHLDDEEDEDDDSEISNTSYDVKLLEILEFNVHHVNEDGNLDEDVYIRTSHAWYILDSASVIYQPFCIAFAVRHRLTHEVISRSLSQPKLTYDAFVASLKPPKHEEASTFGCRHPDKSDLELDDVKEYIRSELIVTKVEPKIRRVPLIKTLHSLESIAGVTIITPIVNRVIGRFFERQLEVIRHNRLPDIGDELLEEFEAVRIHNRNPEIVEWGDLAFPDFPEHPYYCSVRIEGTEYKVGDVVAVEPGIDEDAHRAENARSHASRCTNSLANNAWFIKICYLYEDEERGKMFHGQWLQHGNTQQTLLQEMAHPQELFLISECDEQPVASILRKCEVKMLEPDEDCPEPVDDSDPNASKYFCRFQWDGKENFDFSDLPGPGQKSINEMLSTLPPDQPCISCARSLRTTRFAEITPLEPSGFIQYGHNYHLHDFVFLRPPWINSSSGSAFDIAQIIKIKGLRPGVTADELVIKVRHFERYTEDQCETFRDERQLYRTRRTEYVRLPDIPERERETTELRIDGTCLVRHLVDQQDIEAWVEAGTLHFYVNEEVDEEGRLVRMKACDLKPCERCLQDTIREGQEKEDYLALHGRAKAFEVFCGAGGLSEGLHRSGYMETAWAVEQAPSAAQTFRANHPDADVFCCDTNMVLQHLMDIGNDRNPRPLRTVNGPPCQSFSFANRNPKKDDIRSTLPYSLLSFVEALQPKYVLIENVFGLLHHRLEGSDDSDALITGGTVKLILRVLLALGYQVRHKVLQAAQYGAPQTRRRVIFIAAKRGIPLPSFPLPSHAAPKGNTFSTLPINARMPPLTTSRVPNNYHQWAPHPHVTIKDAIGDLPRFDWSHPHKVVKATPADVAERRHRERQGIAQVDAVTFGNQKSLVGFDAPTAYATAPRTRYQRCMRQGSGDLVKNQVTKSYPSTIVETCVCVPLKAWANHRSLPEALRHPIEQRMEKKKQGKKEKKQLFKEPIYFGRLDPNDMFYTAVTTLNITAPNAHVLHYSDKRSIAIAEIKRSQGFPDCYELVSTHSAPGKKADDFLKLIGNAVPIWLAQALGKTIGAAMVQDWRERKYRRETNSRENSPEV